MKILREIIQNKKNSKKIITSIAIFCLSISIIILNLNIYNQKKERDKVYAVRLGHYLTESFGENSTMDLSDEELNDIKNDLVENIGESPVGNGVYYRAKGTFDDNHTQVGDKHFLYGDEIKPDHKDCNGNTYFDYAN